MPQDLSYGSYILYRLFSMWPPICDGAANFAANSQLIIPLGYTGYLPLRNAVTAPRWSRRHWKQLQRESCLQLLHAARCLLRVEPKSSFRSFTFLLYIGILNIHRCRFNSAECILTLSSLGNDLSLVGLSHLGCLSRK